MIEKIVKIILFLLALLALAIFVLPFTAKAQTKNLVFSVQPGITSAIATGSASATLTISGSTATFSSALPDSVGVGDILVYDANNNGTVDNLAVIRERTTSCVWTVKDSIDGTSGLNNVTGDADWSIYRAYTSLNNAVASTENTGVPLALRGFNIWGGAATLITPNLTMTFACYPGTDASTLSLIAITSNGTNWLKAYTPYLPTEVGRRMRHSGKWTGRAYALATTSGVTVDMSTGSGIAHNFRFEGIQFKNTATTGAADGIYCTSNSGAQTLIVKDCIFVGSANTNNNTRHSGIYFFSANTARLYVSNSIFYDWQSSAVSNTNAAIAFDAGTDDSCWVYNSTAWRGDRGYVSLTTTKTFTAKNCIAGGPGTNWQVGVGTFNDNCTNNTDSKSAAPGANARITQRPAFTDSTNNDFSLTVSDTVARNTGVDLGSGYAIQVTDDVKNASRVGLTYDRGAHEQGATYSPDFGQCTAAVLKRRRVSPH